MQAAPSRLASKAASSAASLSRLVYSSSAPLASTSYAIPASSTSSYSTPSARHASSVSYIERPVPVKVVDPASSSSSTTTNSANRSKGKGRPASERELPLRKQFLLQQYKQIFQTSPVVIFLKPSDFTVAEITKLRVDLSAVASSSPSSNKSKAPTASDINDASSNKPRFVFLRAGLLPPTFEQLPDLPSSQVLSHLSKQGSTLAALTFNTFDPPTLKAALKAVTKLSKSPNVRKEQAEAAAAKAAAGPASGKAKAGAPAAAGNAARKASAEERLTVVSAIVDGKAVSPQELTGIADLPSLEQVLAQLVAIIETPARQIYQIAGQAAGQDLLRTLQGFKIGLEEQERMQSKEE